jgi:uncharacterized protein (TIGR02646 family)
MKKINKSEPAFYQDYISRNKPGKWKQLSFDIGFDMRTYMLMEEQNFQCAYTEIRLEPEQSHIDHFKKKSLYPNLTFHWNNLLTSSNYDFYGARFKDKHIKKAHYQNIMNPVIENPQQYFTYSFTGEILIDPKDEKAKLTVEIFNLNDRSLVEQRKAIAGVIKSMVHQFTVEELIDYIGKFESFIRALYSELKNNENVE